MMNVRQAIHTFVANRPAAAARRRATMLWAVLMILCLLAACAAAETGDPAVQLVTQTPPTPSPIPPTREIILVTPTALATDDAPQKLVVWWPEPLAPLDNDSAAELLSEQLGGFQAENEDVTVEFRLKKVQDVGGILSTLRTASVVAQGAMPDLTLLRRDDLLIAVQAGLVQPLSQRLSPAVLEDLQPIGLDLGRVGDQLYGLPYTLQVLHVAYPSETAPEGAEYLDTLLENDIPFIFAAGRTTGINPVLLLQYLAAGGTITETGTIDLDADALRATLAFYEQATEAGIVTPDVLEYTSPTDYLEALLAEDARGAVVLTSDIYGELVEAGVDMSVGPIPTVTGAPTTIVDGWMWVLTTPDERRQDLALRFLTWMLDTERQASYAGTIHAIPSQRSAIQQMERVEYSRFVTDLLTNGIVPPTETETGVVARALQNALAAVISGQRSAAEATRDVLNQLAG